mgnify:CR=1 FL=1
MSVLNRFLNYIKIDSPSDPKNYGVTPSTEIQLNVAKFLENEMNEMGLVKTIKTIGNTATTASLNLFLGIL